MNAETAMSKGDPGPMPALLEFAEVRQRTKLSRTTLWELERDGKFPKRLHLSPRKVAWLEPEIDAWLRARREERGPSGH